MQCSSQFSDSATGRKIRGSNFGRGKIFFLNPNRLWSSAFVLFNVYRPPFLGSKRQGRGLDDSPPLSAEIKNIWSPTSISLYAFMASPGTKSPYQSVAFELLNYIQKTEFFNIQHEFRGD